MNQKAVSVIFISFLLISAGCAQTNDLNSSGSQKAENHSGDYEAEHGDGGDYADGEMQSKGPRSQMGASSHPPKGGDAHPDVDPNAPKNSKLVVPDATRARWEAVKLVIEEKHSRSIKEFVIPIGQEIDLASGGKTFKISAETFLPDFKIEESPEGQVYTSVSDNPDNPAVKLHVSEAGQEIFNGWIFSMFPSMHPFKHDLIGITLKEGIIKK